MLKFFIIVGIGVYVLYKLMTFFYRMGAASQHFRQYEDQKRSEFGKNGRADKGTKEKDSKVKGGEYIDYEEVK